jgi:hypothetical protein
MVAACFKAVAQNLFEGLMERRNTSVCRAYGPRFWLVTSRLWSDCRFCSGLIQFLINTDIDLVFEYFFLEWFVSEIFSVIFGEEYESRNSAMCNFVFSWLVFRKSEYFSKHFVFKDVILFLLLFFLTPGWIQETWSLDCLLFISLTAESNLCGGPLRQWVAVIFSRGQWPLRLTNAKTFTQCSDAKIQGKYNFSFFASRILRSHIRVCEMFISRRTGTCSTNTSAHSDHCNIPKPGWWKQTNLQVNETVTV